MTERTKHLTTEELAALTSGTLPAAEEAELFAHAGVCDYCAELLSAYVEQELLEPPAYLREEILEKSRRPDIQAARTIRRTSRQTRLFLYSLKVGFALAVSLLMLFVLPGAGSRSPDPELYFLENTHRSITEKLKEGSDKVDLLLDHLAGWSVFMEYEEE